MDCPTCGKTVPPEPGVVQHHMECHDEPLPNRTCKECEEGFYDPKSRRTYCEECYTGAGKQNGNWKDAKERTECERCGNEFEYYPSNKEGVYCPECVEDTHTGGCKFVKIFATPGWRIPSVCYSHQYQEFLGTPSYAGENFPRIERECEQCGVTFSVLETTLQREPCRFCSQECLYEWMSNELYEGEQSGNVYSGDWWSVRRNARQRDNNECQICGEGEEDIGRKPDVHHITPIREFEDPQDAHELSNVITLCPLCHRHVELGEIPCPEPFLPTESRKG